MTASPEGEAPGPAQRGAAWPRGEPWPHSRLGSAELRRAMLIIPITAWFYSCSVLPPQVKSESAHIWEKKIISVSSGQPERTWPGVGAQCTFCSQRGLPAGLSGSSMTAGLLCKLLSHQCKAWKDPLWILQRNDCCLTSNAVDFIPGSVMDLQSNFRQGTPLHCAAAAPITNTMPTFISHFATS